MRHAMRNVSAGYIGCEWA